MLGELTGEAVEFLGFPRTSLVQPELGASRHECADSYALELGGLDSS